MTHQAWSNSATVSSKGNDGVHCYGVDGCRGGWLYALASDQSVSFGTVKRLEHLFDKAAPGSRIFVDIPIGLRDEIGDARLCDQQARRFLAPLRTSSVFNAPLRVILAIDDYPEANATSKRLSGKGLSKQSFNIMPKIREVDKLITSGDRARGMIREVHPEVCFFGLAGGKPMQFSKKRKEGFDERLELLVRFQPGAENAVESAMSEYPRKIVAADDVLDALVCAVTARMKGQWTTVPEVPELDSKGLPMEMVYCKL
ncbi:MAG: putative RNase H-like nuclease [Halieaceae bacterium]|jgi:predicted RNase H-like nuclease